MACCSLSTQRGLVSKTLAAIGVILLALSCSVPAFGDYEVVPGSYLIQGDEIPHGGVLQVSTMDPGVPFKLATAMGASGTGAEAYRIGRDYCHHKLKTRVRKVRNLPSTKFQQKVKLCSANQIYRAAVTPNDASYGSLWGMTKIGAPTAWETTTGSSSVVVAVIDTGVQYTHPDLAANMWTNPGEIAGNGIDDDGNGKADDVYGIDTVNNDTNPMDDHSHGTHCAGTIGATGNNSVGVAGVNWNVKIMALKFLNSSGSGSTAGAVAAINYAVMMKQRGVNVRVLSNSWGGGGYDAALAEAIKSAEAEGMLFVAAAGNSSNNNDTVPAYPASYTNANVVAVAATDAVDGRALFSSFGPTSVDLGAPGVGILSTVTGSGYASYSGTSMATPHVAGAAALVLAKNANLTVAELKAALLDTVDRVASMNGITVTGGRLNLAAALASVKSEPPAATPTPTATPTATPSPTPTATPASITFTVSATDELDQPLPGLSIAILDADTEALLFKVKTAANGSVTRSLNSKKYAATFLNRDVILRVLAAPTGFTMDGGDQSFTVNYSNENVFTGTALTYALSGTARVRELTGVGNRTRTVLAAGAELRDEDGNVLAVANESGVYQYSNIRYKTILSGLTMTWSANGRTYRASVPPLLVKKNLIKNLVLTLVP